MSFDDDGTYANGADGSCQRCGEPTDEPWHLLCRNCFAEERGWTRPARPKPGTPPTSFVEGARAAFARSSRSSRARIEVLERPGGPHR